MGQITLSPTTNEKIMYEIKVVDEAQEKGFLIYPSTEPLSLTLEDSKNYEVTVNHIGSSITETLKGNLDYNFTERYGLDLTKETVIGHLAQATVPTASVVATSSSKGTTNESKNTTNN